MITLMSTTLLLASLMLSVATSIELYKLTQEKKDVAEARLNGLNELNRSVEAQIRSCMVYKEAILDQLDRLEEIKEEFMNNSNANVESIAEITLDIRLKEDNIVKIQESMNILENWYFINNGRHFMLPNENLHFMDFNNTMSVN